MRQKSLVGTPLEPFFAVLRICFMIIRCFCYQDKDDDLFISAKKSLPRSIGTGDGLEINSMRTEAALCAGSYP